MGKTTFKERLGFSCKTKSFEETCRKRKPITLSFIILSVAIIFIILPVFLFGTVSYEESLTTAFVYISGVLITISVSLIISNLIKN